MRLNGDVFFNPHEPEKSRCNLSHPLVAKRTEEVSAAGQSGAEETDKTETKKAR